MKKRRRDEPQRAHSSLALDLSELQDSVEGPRASDDDATEGEWLFKQDDVVLGPVSAAVLVQRIEAGELSASTPVGREAGKWRPLKSVAYFEEMLEKAEARKRALREQLERESRQRRQRMARWSALAALFVVPFLLSAMAGRAVWIAKPWDRGDEWLQRPPPLVDLPPKPKPPPPLPEQKRKVVEKKAEDEGGDDERVAEADANDEQAEKVASAKRPTRKPSASSRKTASQRRTQPAQTQVAAKAADTKKDDDSGGAPLQTLTQKQVMAPVLKSQSAIGRCLKAEVARNPDIPSRVTLMWTVTEAGRATGFKLKEREVRDGPLATCLSGLFNGMRWPRFTGERKNVELPLSVKR